MFYLILFSLVSCLTLLSFVKPMGNKSKYIFVVLWLLVVVAFPLGRDLDSYIAVFERVSTPIADAFKYDSQRNLGFNMMIYYCKQIFGDYVFFRAALNVIVTSLCGYTMYKYSKNLLLSMFLFLFNGIFLWYYGSGVRQMMAMAIFFFAYYNFLIKDKDWLYLISCILAVSFHDLGIVTFLIYILYKFRNVFLNNDKKYMLLMLAGGIIMCSFITLVMPKVVDIIGYETPLKHGLIYFKNISFSVSGLAVRTVMLILNTFIFYFSMSEHDKNDKFLYLTMFMNYCLFIAFSSFGVFARMYDFVAIIELVMIPNLLCKIKNKKIMILGLLGIMGLTSVLMFVDLTQVCFDESYQLDLLSYPYTTVFDSNKVYELINYR